MDSEPVFTVATVATAASIEAMPEQPQPHKWLVAVAVLLGAILTILDGSIINVAAVHAAKLWRWRQQGQQGGNELPGGGQRDDSDEWMDRGANGTPALPAYLGAGQFIFNAVPWHDFDFAFATTDYGPSPLIAAMGGTGHQGNLVPTCEYHYAFNGAAVA